MHLSESIALIENRGGKWIHIDVMDGTFVPNITFGQPIVSSIRAATKLPLDVHLMIAQPERYAESFIQAGADIVTFHYESTVHHHRLLQNIRQAGAKCGISIVPSTPVSALEEILPFADVVLVMTVNPGFGGQKLIPECISKIKKLRELRKQTGYSFKISADGGIDEKTLKPVADAGADVVVSGSAFFSGKLAVRAC